MGAPGYWPDFPISCSRSVGGGGVTCLIHLPLPSGDSPVLGSSVMSCVNSPLPSPLPRELIVRLPWGGGTVGGTGMGTGPDPALSWQMVPFFLVWRLGASEGARERFWLRQASCRGHPAGGAQLESGLGRGGWMPWTRPACAPALGFRPLFCPQTRLTSLPGAAAARPRGGITVDRASFCLGCGGSGQPWSQRDLVPVPPPPPRRRPLPASVSWPV